MWLMRLSHLRRTAQPVFLTNSISSNKTQLYLIPTSLFFFPLLRTQLSDCWRWPDLWALLRHHVFLFFFREIFPLSFYVSLNFVSVRCVDWTGSRFDGDLHCDPIYPSIPANNPYAWTKISNFLHRLMRHSMDSLGEVGGGEKNR